MTWQATQEPPRARSKANFIPLAGSPSIGPASFRGSCLGGGGEASLRSVFQAPKILLRPVAVALPRPRGRLAVERERRFGGERRGPDERDDGAREECRAHHETWSLCCAL
jgi:hypothetical protein